MFQLALDVVMVGGFIWLFLSGIFWIKKQFQKSSEKQPDSVEVRVSKNATKKKENENA